MYVIMRKAGFLSPKRCRPMGVGAGNNFKSDKTVYSTPLALFKPICDEFSLELDVCASPENHKCPVYFTEENDAFKQDWVGNCWMNPPFGSDLQKWVKRARDEAIKHGGTKVCLIPVRSNTRWWADVIKDAEIRFITGEVNFNEAERGLWLPLCFLIFGDKAKVGKFSSVVYKK